MRIYTKKIEHEAIDTDREYIEKEWMLETHDDPDFDNAMLDKFMHIKVINKRYAGVKPTLILKGSGTNWFSRREANTPLKKKVLAMVMDFLKDELIPNTPTI